jgi:hypothetical protein
MILSGRRCSHLNLTLSALPGFDSRVADGSPETTVPSCDSCRPGRMTALNNLTMSRAFVTTRRSLTATGKPGKEKPNTAHAACDLGPAVIGARSRRHNFEPCADLYRVGAGGFSTAGCAANSCFWTGYSLSDFPFLGLVLVAWGRDTCGRSCG